MNNEMIVIDVRELRDKRAQQIAALEASIEQRKHKARVTERYIRLFGGCLPKKELIRLQSHAVEMYGSIFGMIDDLEALRVQPLY